MRRLFRFAIVALCVIWSIAGANAGNGNDERARHWRGTAVFGVDVAGRWVIALDSTRDGVFDYYWRFAAEQYMAGPWFQTADVRILQKQRRLTLETTDGHYFVGLSMERVPRIRAPGSATYVHIHQNGIGLIGTSGTPKRLDSFDPMDLTAWPPGFDFDLINPGTGSIVCPPRQGTFFTTEGCDGGGIGSTSCSVAGCPQAPTGCSAACPTTCFACCSCVHVGQIFPPNIAQCACFAEPGPSGGH